MWFSRLLKSVLSMQAHPFSAGAFVQVSRSAPALPGGYKVGEKVLFTGESKTWEDGDKRMHGQQGEVVGPDTSGAGLLVRFPGNKDRIGCNLAHVRRLRAAAPAASPAASLAACAPSRTRRCPRAAQPPAQ